MSGGGGEEANGPREHRLLLLPFGQRMDERNKVDGRLRRGSVSKEHFLIFFSVSFFIVWVRKWPLARNH